MKIMLVMTNYYAKNYANTICQSLLFTQRLQALLEMEKKNSLRNYWWGCSLPSLIAPFISRCNVITSLYKAINLGKTFLRISRI